MSIQREFILRYRIDGHVRFQIPALICEASIAKAITEAILAIDGVYRVNLYRGQKKLSIRFHESLCDFKSLAKQLFLLLDELKKKGLLNPEQVTKSQPLSQWKQKTRSKLDEFKATRWAKEKYGDARDTFQAAKIIGKIGIKKPKAFIKDPEKAVIDFLNDILVLYLIKTHWNSITQHWLVKPFKHRYELMAMFYMFFLLVRSRKKK
jgi:hypothetical protein